MWFLTKSSSAQRSTTFVLLLALCCLSSAMGAKLTKRVIEKPAANNADKAEAAAAQTNADKVEQTDDDDNDDDDDDEDSEELADKEAAVASTNNKNQLLATPDTTDLSVWGIVRSLWSWVRSDLSESLFGDDEEKPAADTTTAAVEGRTFGKIRRLQMALIPIIFKFGVLSAMVAFLVAIGMKSLFLLKVLVVMNALAILGKFLTLKTSLFGQLDHAAPSFSYPGWNTNVKESWAPTGYSGTASHGPSKEIHLHIHGNAQTQAALAAQGYGYENTQTGWASRSDPYNAYQQPQAVGELAVPNVTDPINLLPTKYPARYLRR